MSSRLAVDLGTSHTVAVIERTGQPARPLLFDGSPVLPSGVFAAADGAIHTGRDAERLAQIEPHRFEPHPKQRVDEGTILLGDAEYPVAVLLAAILGRVLQEAALAHGSTVVLTCPADWGRVRRAVLLDAARRAGIPNPVLVDEPVAAAAYCTRVLGGHVPAGQSLLVFDFGGGTLDLALVRLDHTGTRVTGVGGLQNLGGLDVDHALIGHLGQLLSGRDPALWQRLQRPAGLADLRDRRMFWDEVRAAKEMLSRTTSAPVPLPGGGAPLHLTREELERLAGPLIDRAVDETRRLLDGAAAAGNGGPLGGILLVGGSSRIPLVATRLHARFGVGPMVPEQPELPVALGALATLTDGQAGQQAPAGFGGAASSAYGGGGAGAAGSPFGGGYGSEPESGDQRAVGPTSGPVSAPAGPGVPVSAVPVSGDPGRAWTGQTSGAWAAEPPSWPPANTGGQGVNGPGGGYGTPHGQPVNLGAYGQQPPQPRRRGPRGATLVAIAASVALLVLAGATIWFVRDALGDKNGAKNGGDTPAAAAGAPSAAASTTPSARRPAPSEFAWCDTLGKEVFCPVTPYCEDEAEDEIDCAEPHTLQTYVGGYLPPGTGFGAEEIKERPEVKAACTEQMLAARSVDPAKTKGWAIYLQGGSINGAAMFYCHAGPRTGTVKGNSFKPVT